MLENWCDVCQLIISQVNEYFEVYTSESYIAPYTSIVGPSGVGKSYTSQHIAWRDISIAYAGLPIIPHRYIKITFSADRIPWLHDWESLASYFECYVAATTSISLSHGLRNCTSISSSTMLFEQVFLRQHKVIIEHWCTMGWNCSPTNFMSSL